MWEQKRPCLVWTEHRCVITWISWIDYCTPNVWLFLFIFLFVLTCLFVFFWPSATSFAPPTCDDPCTSATRHREFRRQPKSRKRWCVIKTLHNRSTLTIKRQEKSQSRLPSSPCMTRESSSMISVTQHQCGIHIIRDHPRYGKY